MEQTKTELRAALTNFPPIVHAFAYGSSVFSQGHTLTGNLQTDLVLVVEDAESWHEKNLTTNRGHYSIISWGGAKAIASLQNNYGAHVYFNPFVTLPNSNRVYKYGVVAVEPFLKDLTEWTSLYLAGRLHKPVLPLIRDPRIDKAAQTNLQHGLLCALTLLPCEFSLVSLYSAIAALSYSGDMRMSLWGLGENPNKVSNIVNNNLTHFHRLYHPLLVKNTFLRFSSSLGELPGAGAEVDVLVRTHLEQDMSPESRDLLCQQLPPPLRPKSSEVRALLAQNERMLAKHVKTGISSIVWRTSWTQTAKGVATAGVIKSVKYALHKLAKAVRK